MTYFILCSGEEDYLIYNMGDSLIYVKHSIRMMTDSEWGCRMVTFMNSKYIPIIEELPLPYLFQVMPYSIRGFYLINQLI